MDVISIDQTLGARAGGLTETAYLRMERIVTERHLYFTRSGLLTSAVIYGLKFNHEISTIAMLDEPKWRQHLIDFTVQAARKQIANQLDMSAPLNQTDAYVPLTPLRPLNHESRHYFDLALRIRDIINETMGERGLIIPNVTFIAVSQLYALRHLPALKTVDALDEPARKKHLVNYIIDAAAYSVTPQEPIDTTDHMQVLAYHKRFGSRLFEIELMNTTLEQDYGDKNYLSIPFDIDFWRDLQKRATICRMTHVYSNDDHCTYDDDQQEVES
jgi:hypothetical protein